MRTTRLSLTATATLAAGLLAACAGPPPVDPNTPVPVTIRFAAQVNGQPFACGTRYPGVGTTHSALIPSDLRFYVSALHLIDADGRAVPVRLAQDGVWQVDDIALLDFENGGGPCRTGTPATNTQVRGTVPPGRYTGLRLTLGVPFARNHADPTTAPAPLNHTALFWNWQGGYKFLKFDTSTTRQPAAPTASPPEHGGGSASGFSVHLGSTQCSSASPQAAPAECRAPNRVTVTFDRFDAGRNTVVADLGALLAQTNVDANAPDSAPGCMSQPGDADCATVMAAFGLPWDGRPAEGAQRLFSVR